MKQSLKLLLGIIAGICLGVVIIILGGLKLKWLLAFILLMCFPIFVAGVGSLKRSFLAILILSFSTQAASFPFYSDYYTTLQIGPRISLTGVILIVLYFLWLFDVSRKADRIKFFPKTTIPFFLLLLWCGLSFFYTKKPMYVQLVFFQAIESFLVYFYIANFIKTRDDVHFVVKWASVTVLFTALLTIGQYFKPTLLNIEFMGWAKELLTLNYPGRVITRPSGFLGHANNLASFLASLLPLLMVFIIGSKEKFNQRILQISAFVFGIIALVLTFSRGGWIVFMFSSFIILIFAYKKNIRPKLSKIIPRLFVMALIGIIIVLPFSKNIIRRLTRDDYKAGESRIVLAKEAIEVVKENPFKGLGFGYYLDFRPIPPHNIYIQTAAELGIVGLFIFLWGSAGIFKQGFNALKSNDPTILLFSIGILSGLIGAYIHGMIELGTIGYHKFLLYLFMGGLLVGIGENQKRVFKSE